MAKKLKKGFAESLMMRTIGMTGRETLSDLSAKPKRYIPKYNPERVIRASVIVAEDRYKALAEAYSLSTVISQDAKSGSSKKSIAKKIKTAGVDLWRTIKRILGALINVLLERILGYKRIKDKIINNLKKLETRIKDFDWNGIGNKTIKMNIYKEFDELAKNPKLLDSFQISKDKYNDDLKKYLNYSNSFFGFSALIDKIKNGIGKDNIDKVDMNDVTFKKEAERLTKLSTLTFKYIGKDISKGELKALLDMVMNISENQENLIWTRSLFSILKLMFNLATLYGLTNDNTLNDSVKESFKGYRFMDDAVHYLKTKQFKKESFIEVEYNGSEIQNMLKALFDSCYKSLEAESSFWQTLKRSNKYINYIRNAPTKVTDGLDPKVLQGVRRISWLLTSITNSTFLLFSQVYNFRLKLVNITVNSLTSSIDTERNNTSTEKTSSGPKTKKRSHRKEDIIID